jgi:SAM-dependent methyltransferase
LEPLAENGASTTQALNVKYAQQSEPDTQSGGQVGELPQRADSHVIRRMTSSAPYYRGDLALVHDLGFGFHADRCAPGILALLAPVRQRGGLVLELGCGTGLLTRYLVEAGHRVIATDASPAMLHHGRQVLPNVELRQLVLPDDPLPPADAVVSIGHVLNYLSDEAAVARAAAAMAGALRPGGVLAFDLCDLQWGEARRDSPDLARVEDDWAIVTRFSLPQPSRFVREITTFVRNPDGSWRRDDERHDNVLVDASQIVGLLRSQGVDVVLGTSFGAEELPRGLVTVVGSARPAARSGSAC